MRTGAGFDSMATAAPPPGLHHQQVPHSAWHSPVPYLFGGLAAMLGLIAFALLILACSYWKLSGYLESGSDAEEGGSPDGKPCDVAVKPPPAFFEERIVVIMAGDEKPTFLATPASSRASSFGDNKSSDANNASSSDEATVATKPDPVHGQEQ